MSKNFELMNQGVREAEAVNPSTRGVLRSKPNLANRYSQSVGDAPEEMFAANLWRIIRGRKRTVAAFTLAVVVIVVTASLLMKPQYEAGGHVVFHPQNHTTPPAFKRPHTSPVQNPEDLPT